MDDYNDAISNMVNAITNDNTIEAGKLFNDIVGSKLNDSLDAERARVANNVYQNFADAVDDEQEVDGEQGAEE